MPLTDLNRSVMNTPAHGAIRWLGTGLALLALMAACRRPAPSTPRQSPANLAHILSLVDSVEVDTQQLAFVHIYAEYPDYQPFVAASEGVTCVDDVGRLLEVLEAEILYFDREDLLPVARGLSRFLLHLQRADGTWNNFMWADGSINTSHRNSRAGFGWWAARGLRGLAAAYAIFQERDPPWADTLLARFRLGEPHLAAILAAYPQMVSTGLGPRAGWLPNQAPDQASEFLLALAKMQAHSDLDYSPQIRQLADGLLTYQYRRPGSDVDGLFFCWENLWHGWGNLQALALLEAFQVTSDSTYLAAVEYWADNYLSWAVAQGSFWEISVTAGDSIIATELPQIAYGAGSSYRGIKRLATITRRPEHAALAGRLLGWFSGHNRAGIVMYDPASGRCFDGINDPTTVNRNSGAESTIEALLALQFSALNGP
ncbi:MAG: hypothetical protein IID13_04290 [Candidatus Marinimicrobia bacterium]|nr:hypothetical protein [Candidatus Neomarinimicrobiota bacterium]